MFECLLICQSVLMAIDTALTVHACHLMPRLHVYVIGVCLRRSLISHAARGGFL